jgi:hypothetical protein
MTDKTNTEDLKAVLTEEFDKIEAKIDRILGLLGEMKARAMERRTTKRPQRPSRG